MNTEMIDQNKQEDEDMLLFGDNLMDWKLFARWQLVFSTEIFLVKFNKFFGLKEFFESAQLVKVSARCQ